MPRTGLTLLELTIVLALVGVLAALVIPRSAAMLDRAKVTAATRETVTIFAVARHLAIQSSSRATVFIRQPQGRLLVRVGTDTAHQRDLSRRYGVTLDATQDSMSYHPTGIGYGVANLSVRIRRGNAADTVVVSRLGRVRH